MLYNHCLLILLLPLLQALLVFLLVTDGDIVLLTITPCLILPAVPALLPLPEEPPLPPLPPSSLSNSEMVLGSKCITCTL